MNILMWIYCALILYVSFFKIVCLLFRGKQHNRFFGTLISLIIPVGSFASVILASKYERRVGGPASKMNESMLKCIIVTLQILSVIILFLPFFISDGTSIRGINLFFGKETIGVAMKPVIYLIYIIVAPVISSIINILDKKSNIKNIITYWVSLLLCITLSAYTFAVCTDKTEPMAFLWIYCILNSVIMLFSIFSLIVTRNKFLLAIEETEKTEYIQLQKEKNKSKNEDLHENMYKCAKCGKYIEKGTICSCREKAPDAIEKILEKTTEKAENFCVYCRKPLNPGETCDCAGDGFGITVKAENNSVRKCKYCGQELIGESVCVCEKILKKSVPASDDVSQPVNDSYVEGIKHSFEPSHELEELEKMINQKLNDVRSSLITDNVHEDESENVENN